MGYSTLPTQSAGQTASAAGWANIVKADLESMMHLIARKTSDQSVVSSATFVDDTALVVPVLANEIWQVAFNLIHSGSQTGDFKTRHTFPSGGRWTASMVGFDAVLNTQYRQVDDTVSPGASNAWGESSSVRLYTVFEGVFVNAGTAGNLTLQWAQNTSDGTATTVYANSTVWGMKLA